MVMKTSTGNVTNMTRRELLKGSAVVGAYLVGSQFMAVAPNAAWALEVKHLKAESMATLVQMARDIYPHERVPDKYYARAVKGYDAPDQTQTVEDGIAALNRAAGGGYLSVESEAERVAVLRKMEDGAFFQTVRGGLVTGLYNQKEVWPLFGYEGESFNKGGYLNHGFDDIEWL